MIFETVIAEGLAHFSYLLGDEKAGVAAVIDPRRDISIYLELARKYNLQIAHILETHIHADFVSGSRELASQTGAPIYVGATGDYEFLHQALQDGDTLELGSLRLQVIHTPGHTPGHICFLVSGGTNTDKPWGLFSGDALFNGEVGRPDLLVDGTEKKLAGQLYHSLFDKLLELDDGIIIYPAHGEGSPCGGNIGSRPTSTIGYERRNNPSLQVQDQEEFVEQVLDSSTAVPSYYARMKRINAKGPRALGALPHIEALTPNQFQQEMEKSNTLIIDTREIEAFGGAHISGALSIALRLLFPIWAGWLVQPEQRILLVLADDQHLDTVQRHLLRVGCQNIIGYLRQGMRSWIEAGLPFERTTQLSVHELKEQITSDTYDLQVLDVRSDDEWALGHIPTAQHQYLPYHEPNLEILDKLKPVAVYCGSGYRSSIAASILKQNGFNRVSNIPGSMDAWLSAGYPLEER